MIVKYKTYVIKEIFIVFHINNVYTNMEIKWWQIIFIRHKLQLGWLLKLMNKSNAYLEQSLDAYAACINVNIYLWK